MSLQNDIDLNGPVAMRDRMCDVRENILKAGPKRLAAFLEMDPGPGLLGRPDELAAIFKHQLATPVQLDLAEVTAGNAPAWLPGFPEIRTLDELFRAPKPPIELLKSVKEFAKANRAHPASALPNEIAMVLYYASVIIARWRCSEIITTLNDNELRAGIEWAIAEPWVDENTRSLLREASMTLDRSRNE
jgi:hypothetical protein